MTVGTDTRDIILTEKTLILCDFDGTISTADVGFEIIKRFAKGGWKEIDQAYCEGRIGSKEAYSQIATLMKGSREEMIRFALDNGRIDGSFAAFYCLCRDRGIDMTIVSDGLDFYIEEILKKYKLHEIRFLANVVRFYDNGHISIEFPLSNEECDSCGLCKSRILNDYRLTYDNIIYIGNGYSDVCPAHRADFVFAKDILYENCLKNDRNCIRYDSFDDIKKHFEG